MKITSKATNYTTHTHNNSKLLFLILTVLLTVFYSTIIFGATIYVDPTYNSSTQNGSITNPYNSWSKVTWTNGNSYLQKRGTTTNITGSITITGRSNITIGAYGTGNRPRIIKTSGNGHVIDLTTVSNCTVRDLEISSTSNATTGVLIDGYGTAISSNNLIDNCEIHDCEWGVRIISVAAGNKILNSTIHTTRDDGVYINGVLDIEIGYCTIYNVNTNYFVNQNESYSAGDNIQLVSTNNMVFNIHHNTLDHSSTGNKFCFISAGETYSGVIEHNTMTGNSANVTSCIYLGNTNKTVTVRYNTLKDANYGIYSYADNLQFYYNQVIRNNQGLSIMTNKSLTALNNVFYNNRESCIGAISNTSVTSRNNIFYISGTGARVYSCNSSLVSDYNNFNTQQSNFLNGYSTLASWRSASGNDAHSFVNNPMFVSAGNDDFCVQSGSPCVNTGTNVNLQQDFFGTPVPQSSITDIGFYELAGNQTNNTAPVINSQTFQVNENSSTGTVVGTVIATDPNAGQAITFSITSGNTNNAFTINASTGTLTVSNSQAINYESVNRFQLTVRATDNGTGALWSQATITVNIQNVNENPVISNQSFTASQNASNGTLIGTIAASDPDQGQTLAYTITSGNTNGAFALNQSNGQLTIANATAINGTTYNLVVRATDNGSPVLYAQATISINTSSANNQAPVINNQSFSISGSASNGAAVGTIVASDPNSGQTLTYSITSGNTNSVFGISASSGQLTVANAASLNPGTVSLVVRVTDNGNPAMWSQATITVTVTSSTGNNAPNISNQSFTAVPYSPKGTDIGDVIASDPDAGQSIRYNITGGNTNGAFYIISSLGRLRVANQSAMASGTFYLTVRVTDSGSPFLWSEATVTVTVGNNTANRAPVINNQSFTLSANPPAGTYAGTITASDPDAGQSITYTIRAGNTNTAFNLGSSDGRITVNNYWAVNAGVFYLTVRATDNGNPSMWSEATITITVNEAGGANQQPLIGNQSFSVNENSTSGTFLGKVIASDPDAGQTISYAIVSGNTGNTFNIGTTTGNLTVNNTSGLDFELSPIFNLVVRVTDNGSNSQSAQANITVQLNDVNEAPVLSPATIDIEAYSPNGSFLGAIPASDPDDGQSVNYRIVSGNTSNAFHINYHNGAINVINSSALNPYTNPVFYLTVLVTDNGQPSLSSTAVIKVNVRSFKSGEQNQGTQFVVNEGPIYNLFPNPSNDGHFNLSIENMDEPTLVQVFNLSGKLISEITEVNADLMPINLENMPIGVYMIKITSASHTKTIKAIKN